jgi:hypothetical protein
MNPLNGGTPASANREMVSVKAVIGILLPKPAYESSDVVEILLKIAAAAKKAAVFITPWFNTWNSAPAIPS